MAIFMNYNKIKTELEDRGITIKDFCRQLNVTEQGLHQMIRNGSMKIDVLERISEVLDVPVTYWFIDKCEDAGQRSEPPKMSDVQKIDNITSELNVLLKSLIGKRPK
jgi:transcriptional regulator with XRE-family HTH domain